MSAPLTAVRADDALWHSALVRTYAPSTNASRRAWFREKILTSLRFRTADRAHNWVAAWVPVPMMAATVAVGEANASAATVPIAPVRRGPSSFPTAIRSEEHTL